MRAPPRSAHRNVDNRKELRLAMSTTDERDQKKFEALLAGVAKGMPDAESAKNITDGLRKVWDKPALVELEMVTRRTYNLSQARQLFFFPEPVDMATVVAIVGPAPRGAPADHPQTKVRIQAMALLYMVHAQVWPLPKPLGSCAPVPVYRP